MKIFVDENMAHQTIHALQALGHEILDVRGTTREQTPDNQLWRLAQQEKCLVLTRDGDYLHFRNQPHYGLLVVRLRRSDPDRLHARFMEMLNQFAWNDWPGRTVSARDVAVKVWIGEAP